MAGACAKLKWNRKRLGLSQKEFAKKVGVSEGTICRLERDETAWLTIRNETSDRIAAVFESMASWQPENAGQIMNEIRSELNQEQVVECVPAVIDIPVTVRNVEKGLHKNDEKVLAQIELVWDQMNETDDHEEFMMYIKMLKKIVNKF